MSSTAPALTDDAPLDDRTARARIRDTAIDCFAEHGVAATTARKVAEAAGVSPGLVIHHFGSMEGLRAACDEYTAATIRRYKQRAMSAGPTLDVLAFLREDDVGSLMGYLAQVLADDSAAVARLVDELVADAEVYLQQGVEAGMLRPTNDPRGRAVVLTLWNLGALVLHRHLQRMLGVDLTDPDVYGDPALAGYIGPIYELYGDGIITEAFAARMREALAGTGPEPMEDASPHEGNAPGTAQNEGTS